MTSSAREMLDAILAQLDAVDEAVSDTAPGPANLAGLWEGELVMDLAEPVIRQIRFDQFIREVMSMGADIAMRMGSAAMEYSVGGDQAGAAADPTTDHDSEE